MKEGLGANQTEKALVQVGKSVGLLTKILDSFAGVPLMSGKHSQQCMTKDLKSNFWKQTFLTRGHKSF